MPRGQFGAQPVRPAAVIFKKTQKVLPTDGALVPHTTRPLVRIRIGEAVATRLEQMGSIGCKINVVSGTKVCVNYTVDSMIPLVGMQCEELPVCRSTVARDGQNLETSRDLDHLNGFPYDWIQEIRCNVFSDDCCQWVLKVPAHPRAPWRRVWTACAVPASSCSRWSNNPADTLRNNDVVITSKRRHFDVITSKWRRFDVMTTLLSRHVFRGKLPMSSRLI